MTIVSIAVIQDPDAVRRPAARPFVQDARSAVRLSVSPSRRSQDEVETVLQAVAWHFGRRDGH